MDKETSKPKSLEEYLLEQSRDLLKVKKKEPSPNDPVAPQKSKEPVFQDNSTKSQLSKTDPVPKNNEVQEENSILANSMLDTSTSTISPSQELSELPQHLLTMNDVSEMVRKIDQLTGERNYFRKEVKRKTMDLLDYKRKLMLARNIAENSAKDDEIDMLKEKVQLLEIKNVGNERFKGYFYLLLGFNAIAVLWMLFVFMFRKDDYKFDCIVV